MLNGEINLLKRRVGTVDTAPCCTIGEGSELDNVEATDGKKYEVASLMMALLAIPIIDGPYVGFAFDAMISTPVVTASFVLLNGTSVLR